MPNELYNQERYKELADQIENHSRAIDYLLTELRQTFPAQSEGRHWTLLGNHRPYLIGTDE
jgi:hypothetical protein